MIHAKDISFYFEEGKSVLQNISFDLEEGKTLLPVTNLETEINEKRHTTQTTIPKEGGESLPMMKS